MSWLLNGIFILVSALLGLRYLHMLQLSAYQTPSYLRWLKEHGHEPLMPLALPLAAAFILSFLPDRGRWLACALFAVSALLALPRKKQKKPLVMTARATRVYVGWLAASAVWSVGAYFMPEQRIEIALLTGGLFLTPWGLPTVNHLLNPLQKSINQKYIKEARRILEDSPHLLIIGITGSYGKTTCKHILHAFLSTAFNTLMTPESYNTPMGVVRTIRERLDATHEAFIVEMGARHAGDIAELCDIVKPKHGLVTAVGPMHLETFHDLETVGRTKFELPRALPADGYAFVNWGDANIRRQDTGHLRLVTYAVDVAADYMARDITVGTSGSSFTLTAPGGLSQRIHTPLIGRHNVENVTGALAVAHTLGIPLDRLARAALTLQPVPHRLELKQQQAMTLIDDAFNANPAGAKAALDTLAAIDGYRVLVTPGMVELGERQDELNRELGRQAAAVCDAVILVGERQTRAVADGLVSGGCRRIIVTEDIFRAYAELNALETGGKRKVVLLENDLPDQYG